ncbi:MAG: DUF6577 family protein [bacterium]
MNDRKLHINKLKETFGKEAAFYNKQIADFYRSFEPDIKESAVNWRIFRLVQDGILTRIGRGKYQLKKKKYYIPEISSSLTILNNKLKKHFPYLDYCLWSSALFNEFMRHQPGKYYLILEVEKDAAESIFYFMKEDNYSVFLQPTKELLNKYGLNKKETWIVKSLVTEAPIQEISGIYSTTIEKLLVDLFCDKPFLQAQQGTERNRIFNEAFEKYEFNENKMLRYASRRRKKEEIIDFLNKSTKFRQHFQTTANIKNND